MRFPVDQACCLWVPGRYLCLGAALRVDFAGDGSCQQPTVGTKGILDVIRAERGESGVANDVALHGDGPVNPGFSRRLFRAEIEAKLADNIEKMQAGGEEGVETDQFRVFKFIIEQLEHGEKPLRLMIQASAGTSKSFLLTSVFLWAVLKGVK